MIEPPVPAGTGGTRGTLHRVARGGAVYVVMSALQRAMPFLLLPVFAAVLSPEEYGRIAVLVAVTGALSAVLGFGLETAVLRTYVQLDADPDSRQTFVTSVGIFATLAPLVGAVVAAITLLSTVGLNGEPGAVVVVAFAGAALQTSSTVLVMAVLRAQERLRAYSLVALMQTIGSPVAALLLVAVLDLGVPGWFVAHAGVALATLGVGLVLLEDQWVRRFSIGHLRDALRYGLPLLPHGLSHWTLNLSDRLILAAFVAASTVGVYNVAYQLAAPVGVLLIALRQGTMPLYAEAATRPRVRGDLGRIVTLQAHLTGILGMTVALLGSTVVPLLFPTAYGEAAAFVPLVALGFVFFGLYLIPVDAMSIMLGRTTWLWVPTALAAAVNVGLNLALVPALGAWAAALNTAIAYGILLVGVMVLRSRAAGPRIPYDLRRIAIGVGAAGAAYVAGALLTPEPSGPMALPTRVALVIVTSIGIGVWDWSWWRKRHRAGGAADDLVDQRTDAERTVAGTARG